MVGCRKIRILAVITIAAASLLVSGDVWARGGGSSGGSHSVRGYTAKNGTYVAPHRQTNPNSTQRDNWSTKGNVNPYTGKEGTKTPTK